MGFYADTVFPAISAFSAEPAEVRAARARVVGGASGDVLEIGFGTGASVVHYDARLVRSLTGLDPSSGMLARSRPLVSASLVPIDLVRGSAAAMPFEDAVFDCVVSCMTMCSVGDEAAVLAEVARVLRPGGMFRFLEHVASDRPVVRTCQRALTPLQRLAACGCRLDRDVVRAVAHAGFDVVEVRPVAGRGLSASLMPFVEGLAIRSV